MFKGTLVLNNIQHRIHGIYFNHFTSCWGNRNEIAYPIFHVKVERFGDIFTIGVSFNELKNMLKNEYNPNLHTNSIPHIEPNKIDWDKCVTQGYLDESIHGYDIFNKFITWYNIKSKNIETMAAKKYILVDTKAPVLKGKEILKDPDAGGIKLTYEVANEKTTLSQKDNKRLIYLKPYKENWSVSKKDANKGEWGNTSSPLSNVWLEIKKNYTSYEKESTSIRGDVVKDSNLIAYLNKQTKEFILGSDENIRPIPFKLLILFKIKQTLEIIKSRIFLK